MKLIIIFKIKIMEELKNALASVLADHYASIEVSEEGGFLYLKLVLNNGEEWVADTGYRDLSITSRDLE